MTFLPIVERELRVAARRRFTHWSRVIAAAFTLLIFGAMLTLTLMPNGGGGFSVGQVQFAVLKWMAFIAACAAGVFLTSDSLSEEKREGTLGLLFLTDLRGHDVVLGKLFSHSLRAFYGLLAALPILALPLMVGGVSGAEFGRAMLVICNTLFISLAAGMFISAISREVIKAMNGALFLILLFLVILPWADFGMAHWDQSKFTCILSSASPGYLFATSSRLPSRDYWFYLGLQHLLGWSFLVLASVCIPRAWQEKTADPGGRRQSLMGRFRFGGPRGRAALRHRLLRTNPILWLALRDRWLARFVLAAMVIAAGTMLGWNMYAYGDLRHLGNALDGAQWFLELGLVLWICAQACRLFVDAVGNGAMELILVTPIIPRQIVRGQWAALLKIFLLPTLILLILQVKAGIDGIETMKKTMANLRTSLVTSSAGVSTNSQVSTSTVTSTVTVNGVTVSSTSSSGGAGTNASGGTVTAVSPNFDMVTFQIVSLVTGIFNLVTNLLALAWFGMWMGLTTRKTSIAVLKALCFVLVLPWLVEIFVLGLAMGYSAFSGWPFWLGTVAASVLNLLKNIFFIVWSRSRLSSNFRETVARSGRTKMERMPPPGISVPTGLTISP